MDTKAYKGIIYRLWYKVVNNDIETLASFYRYIRREEGRARGMIRGSIERFKNNEIDEERCSKYIRESVDYEVALTMMKNTIRDAKIVDIDRLMQFIDMEKERFGIVLAHEDPKETEKLMGFLGKK